MLVCGIYSNFTMGYTEIRKTYMAATAKETSWRLEATEKFVYDDKLRLVETYEIGNDGNEIQTYRKTYYDSIGISTSEYDFKNKIRTECYYDNKNKLYQKKITRENAAESTSKIMIRYDDESRKILEETFDDIGTLEYMNCFWHDRKGRIIIELNYSSEHGLLYSKNWHYDDEKKIMRYVFYRYFDGQSSESISTFNEIGLEISHKSADGSYSTTEYNEKGQKVKFLETRYDIWGTHEEQQATRRASELYTYDENDRIKKVVKRRDGLTFLIQYDYS
jgi:hypothetical protein